MKNPVSINLLGASFTLMVDEDPDYIQAIETSLEEKINQIQNSFPVKDPLKISLLVCIFLTDELFREKSKTAEEEKNLKLITEKLLDKVNSVLENE